MALKKSSSVENGIYDTTSGKLFKVYDNKVTCDDGTKKFTSSVKQQAEWIDKKTNRNR
jgi:hypothetical protein